MSWEERTANQMRKEFVERVPAQKKAKAACADKWIARYLAGESPGWQC